MHTRLGAQLVPHVSLCQQHALTLLHALLLTGSAESKQAFNTKVNAGAAGV